MFTYTHTEIDSIQAAKTNTLKNLVTDEKIREPLQAIIDAETKFAKSIADIADDVYSQFTSQLQKFFVKQ
jgi:hypothetical protein